ncbi:hypothetical protein [Streptomyces sp. NPDC090798]|uniref:hypothetical protein n=1 Tax=Streptomyces sp. NPDC090798 TaxID=3365968 RepID=UPI00381142BC
MRLRKRAIAAVFVATAAFSAVGPQAMALPMPWETSKVPAAGAQDTRSSTTHGEAHTVSVLCSGNCYQ